MKKISRLLALVIIALSLNSCLNIKSEYPAVEYYRLTQEKGQSRKNLKISAALQIRDFSISEEFNTEHLIAQNPDKSIQKYFYHRWVGDIGYMITDFFVTKLNEYNFFANGVIKSNSIQIPDYILEGQILEIIANNSEEESGNNNISITTKMTLLKKDKEKTSYSVLFNKTYHIEIPRKDNSVRSIVPAFSVGFSQISDKLMQEIIAPIGNTEGNNE